jgi:hypothetical protein
VGPELEIEIENIKHYTAKLDEIDKDNVRKAAAFENIRWQGKWRKGLEKLLSSVNMKMT